MEASDHENCCSGPPPPKFLLCPPPPPPPPTSGSTEFPDASTSDLRMCKILSVIDAEYHSGQVVPSAAVVVVVAAATVLVFCCIGIVLVVLKKGKLRHRVPGKSSPQNPFHGASVGGAIYEDFDNVLSSSCPHGHSAEMIRTNSYTAGPMIFSSLLLRSHPSSGRNACDYQNLFNPETEDPSDNPFCLDECYRSRGNEYSCIADGEPRIGTGEASPKKSGENPEIDDSEGENIYECLDPPEEGSSKNEYFTIDEIAFGGNLEGNTCCSSSSSTQQHLQHALARNVLDRRRPSADDHFLEDFFHFNSMAIRDGKDGGCGNQGKSALSFGEKGKRGNRIGNT